MTLKRCFVLFLFLVYGIGCSAAYEPLQEDAFYSVNADTFYFHDVESDGYYEMYACYKDNAGRTYVNAFQETGRPLWSTYFEKIARDYSGCTPVRGEVNYVAVDDVDSNGKEDIFVAMRVTDAHLNINVISRYERGGAEENHGIKSIWDDQFNGVVLNGVTSGISTEDLDADGLKEIIAYTVGGEIYVYDVDGNLEDKYDLDNAIYGISVSDIDNDGKKEIVAGAYTGAYIIDGDQKSYIQTDRKMYAVASGRIKEESIGAVVASGGLRLYAFDNEGYPLWDSDVEGVVDEGDVKALAIADADNDAYTEVLVAVNDSIVAYDASGKFKWTYRVGDRISAMSILSEDRVAVSGKKGVYVMGANVAYSKNRTAYDYYENARGFYDKDDCERALPRADAAYAIFREINNSYGMLKADLIVQQCQIDIDKKRLADEYYSYALKYFNISDYENAKTYAERAMEIYYDIGDTYSVTFKCDSLLLQIREAGYEANRKEAEYFLSEAYGNIREEDYAAAASYVERAYDIFLAINDTAGMEKAALLSSEIEEKERKKTADDFYLLGREKLEIGSYPEAISPLGQAETIYGELGSGEDAEKAKKLREAALSYMEAAEYIQTATNYTRAGDYENARRYANQSHAIYLELGDYEKAVEAEYLTEEINKKISDSQMMTAATIAAVILALSGAAVFFYSKKKKRLEGAGP